MISSMDQGKGTIAEESEKSEVEVYVCEYNIICPDLMV